MSQPLHPHDGEALNAPVREPSPASEQTPVREPGHEPGHGPDGDPDPDLDPVRDPSRAPAREPVVDPNPDPDVVPEIDPVPQRHPDPTGSAAPGAPGAAAQIDTAAPVKHSTKRVPNSRSTAVGDRIVAGMADPTPDVAVNPSGALILIADDEPNILISLEYLMKREGYRVSVARDGKQALEAILNERPALVLLDVMMPKKSGFEVCQEVRANDSVRDTLILMLTAKGRDTDLAKGLGSGADAYMTKPFSTKELVVKVRAMLDARA